MQTIVTLAQMRAKIPGPVHPKWPAGERFAQAMAHGSMSVELYAPVGIDPQQPHVQDELYVVAEGTAEFVMNGDVSEVSAGHVLFVPAGTPHHFQRIASGFAAWVVFWGPPGGETVAPSDRMAIAAP